MQNVYYAGMSLFSQNRSNHNLKGFWLLFRLALLCALVCGSNSIDMIDIIYGTVEQYRKAMSMMSFRDAHRAVQNDIAPNRDFYSNS